VDPQGSIKTLLDKRLVRIAGKKKVVGRPFLYATTREFLMHFGLASIDDLPPIEDFERLAGELIASSGPEAGGADEIGAEPEPEESLPRPVSFGRGGPADAEVTVPEDEEE
jgi:segregation and condensation protein B